MRLLADWSTSSRAQIGGIFTDIDDTLTTDGAITPDALTALGALRAAGLTVVAITGRPIGWCAPFMHATPPWPVHAMVAENGAVAWVETPGGMPRKLYQQDEPTRIALAERMRVAAEAIEAAMPGVQRTDDGGGRETDVAFDYHEHVRLSDAQVRELVERLQQAGMRTTVSSIHVHGCFADFDKWSGARWIVRELLGRDLTQELDRWVFVGDSGNDQPMFEHFRHSVGVANIRRFEPTLRFLPTYIAPSERGAGFAEVAQALLQARASDSAAR